MGRLPDPVLMVWSLLLYMAKRHRYNLTWFWIIILLGGPPDVRKDCNCSIFDLTLLNVSTRFCCWSGLLYLADILLTLLQLLIMLLLTSTDLNPLMSISMSKRPEGPVGRRSNKGQSYLQASHSHRKKKPS